MSKPNSSLTQKWAALAGTMESYTVGNLRYKNTVYEDFIEGFLCYYTALYPSQLLGKY